jgi:hypothetical protein
VPDPDALRRYVQGSGAEFSVAQEVYTQTRSGWFSDRTVRYLASGKPALVQDTGFCRNYPVGEGLLAFSTLEEAVAGAGRIARLRGTLPWGPRSSGGILRFGQSPGPVRRGGRRRAMNSGLS